MKNECNTEQEAKEKLIKSSFNASNTFQTR